MHQLHQRS